MTLHGHLRSWTYCRDFPDVAFYDLDWQTHDVLVVDGGRSWSQQWAAEQEEFIRARRGALDVAFSLTENTWRNETSIELSVADVK